MSRTLTAAAKAASQDEVVRPVSLVELDFSSGFVRANSAPIDIVAFSNTFLGVGNLGAITSSGEGADLQARGISLQLSGIPTALVSIALGEHYQGRSCKVWMGLLDSSHVLIADPVLMFDGRMDTMDINMGETAVINVTAESRLSDWERPRIRRYTNEDQQNQYPNDKGFEFVPQMADKQLIWGRT